MSGHSKWSKIKNKKGAADAKRGNLFTKLGKNITVAARDGGGDPDSNFKLRLAMDKARQANMPKDNIERAIKRGTGELAGARIEEVIYEGFGPEGVALVIEALSDNKNRTVSNVRHILTKHGGSLGAANTTLWMFERKGVVRIEDIDSKVKDLEELQLKLIEMGAEDFAKEEDGLAVYIGLEDFQKVKEGLEKEELPADYAEIEMVAKNKVKVSEKAMEKLEKIFSDLDDDDDVSNYYSNLEE